MHTSLVPESSAVFSTISSTLTLYIDISSLIICLQPLNLVFKFAHNISLYIQHILLLLHLFGFSGKKTPNIKTVQL